MNAITQTLRDTHASVALTRVNYTICPVLVASNIAVELGWLEEEFRKVGADPVYLRSLPDNAGWLPHFTHGLPALFREGGAIPAIHAKADLIDTTLVGLTWVRNGSGGQILVASDSGIHTVADLKGRRVGLYRSLNKDKVDFRRATAERGILLALELAGLTRGDVEVVNLDDGETPQYQPAAKPAEYLAQGREKEKKSDPEIEALRKGRVDAVYASGGRAEKLVESGAFTAIEDLSRHPDWRLQIANSPFTNAVNTDFAREHPEVVVAFLRASIRAGRLVNENPSLAAQFFQRTTGYHDAHRILRLIDGVNLVPQLSERNLAALDVQKKFLLDHGYIKNDFDVRSWVDDTYLQEALRSL
jgi:ABC-type nitrate/sulfonate/bicarbonate transport system substrate-binding protein